MYDKEFDPRALIFLILGSFSAVNALAQNTGNGDDGGSHEWRSFAIAAQKAFQANDLTTAQKDWQSALNLAEKEGEIEPGVVNCLVSLALVADKRGDTYESERLYELGMRQMEALVGPQDIRMTKYMPGLAWLYDRHGKTEKAEVLFQRVLRLKEQKYGKESMELVGSMRDYALFLQKAGRQSEAQTWEQRAKRIEDSGRL
jgi:tetratricopeptide (TPR) repeat protein